MCTSNLWLIHFQPSMLLEHSQKMSASCMGCQSIPRKCSQAAWDSEVYCEWPISYFPKLIWPVYFKIQVTKLQLSTAYHPQSKVVNRVLETNLRCYAERQPHNWMAFLSWAEYAYNTACYSAIGCHHLRKRMGGWIPLMAEYAHNTACHTATGLSPFEAVYGRSSPVLHRFHPWGK